MDTDLNNSNMQEADYLAALLLKQLRQEITDNELQFLENWKASHPAHAEVSERVNNEKQLLADLLAMKQVDLEGWWQKISAQVEPVRQPVPLVRRWYAWAAAAAILLIAGAVTWQYWPAKKQTLSVTEKQTPATVLPGGNKASLTLSNGSVINLVNAVDGKVAEEGNSRIIKRANGELSYEPANDNKALTAVAMNTLSTPRGGQYKLVLPDGSKVWLNAASSITYPTQFAANERQVTITGEAYFEVAQAHQKDAGKERLPFIVTVQSPAGRKLAQVHVLGTTFNIMAYADEGAIKTTLLKGKVKVAVPAAAPGKNEHVRLLTPGQQAQVPQTTGAAGNDSIRVIHLEDMETAFAWTNGFIPLKNSDLPSIMRALSRWYDIEVVYQGKIPDYTFGGSIPRTENFSSVLKILEYQGVHCKLQEHTLIVLP